MGITPLQNERGCPVVSLGGRHGLFLGVQKGNSNIFVSITEGFPYRSIYLTDKLRHTALEYV